MVFPRMGIRLPAHCLDREQLDHDQQPHRPDAEDRRRRQPFERAGRRGRLDERFASRRWARSCWCWPSRGCGRRIGTMSAAKARASVRRLVRPGWRWRPKPPVGDDPILWREMNTVPCISARQGDGCRDQSGDLRHSRLCHLLFRATRTDRGMAPWLRGGDHDRRTA